MKRMYRCWKNRGGKICQIFICGFPAASEMPQISSIILSISRGEVGNIRKRFWKDMKVISIQMLIPDTMQFRSKTLSSLHASASDFRGCTSQRYPYPGNIKTCGSNPPSESTLWHRVRIEGAFSWPEEKERLIRAKTLLKAFWSWAEKNAMGELRNPNFRTFFIARWRTVRDFFTTWKMETVPSVILLQKTVSDHLWLAERTVCSPVAWKGLEPVQESIHRFIWRLPLKSERTELYSCEQWAKYPAVCHSAGFLGMLQNTNSGGFCNIPLWFRQVIWTIHIGRAQSKNNTSRKWK